MTKAQAKKVLALTLKIEALTGRALDALGDDPMQGEVWSALNNASAAAQWAADLCRKQA